MKIGRQKVRRKRTYAPPVKVTIAESNLDYRDIWKQIEEGVKAEADPEERLMFSEAVHDCPFKETLSKQAK